MGQCCSGPRRRALDRSGTIRRYSLHAEVRRRAVKSWRARRRRFLQAGGRLELTLWQVCGTRRCLAAAAVACAFTKLGVAAGDLGRVNPALRRNGSEAAGRVSGRRTQEPTWPPCVCQAVRLVSTERNGKGCAHSRAFMCRIGQFRLCNRSAMRSVRDPNPDIARLPRRQNQAARKRRSGCF